MRTLSIAACLAAFVTASLPAQAVDPDPARFAAEMTSFASWDSRNSVPADSVLFVGSSTIRMWPTAQRFPTRPVVNRGFGGSHISDVLHYLDQTVLRYRPAVVVFYAGDNDIAAKKSSQRVFDDFRQVVTRILAARADTDVVFVAIKPSPSRWELWPAMRDANALVRAFADSHPRVHYADIVPATLGADGQPKPELFVADRLHLSTAGYDAWTAALTPVLDQILAARARRP